MKKASWKCSSDESPERVQVALPNRFYPVRVDVGSSEVRSGVIKNSYGDSHVISRHEFPSAKPSLAEAIDLDASVHLFKWHSIHVVGE